MNGAAGVFCQQQGKAGLFQCNDALDPCCDLAEKIPPIGFSTAF